MVVELIPRVAVIGEGRIEIEGPTSEILADTSLLENQGLEVS